MLSENPYVDHSMTGVIVNIRTGILSNWVMKAFSYLRSVHAQIGTRCGYLLLRVSN